LTTRTEPQLAEQTQSSITLTIQNLEQKQKIEELSRELEAKDRELFQKTLEIKERDLIIKDRDLTIREKDIANKEQNMTIEGLRRVIRGKNIYIKENDRAIKGLDRQVSTQEGIKENLGKHVLMNEDYALSAQFKNRTEYGKLGHKKRGEVLGKDIRAAKNSLFDGFKLAEDNGTKNHGGSQPRASVSSETASRGHASVHSVSNHPAVPSGKPLSRFRISRPDKRPFSEVSTLALASSSQAEHCESASRNMRHQKMTAYLVFSLNLAWVEVGERGTKSRGLNNFGTHLFVFAC